MKILLLIALTTGTLFLNSPGIAQESSAQKSQSSRVIAKARSQNTLDWGLRDTAPPVSYTDNNGQLRGFCTELIDVLEKYLKEKNYVEDGFKINREPIKHVNRFKRTSKHELDGECGPDSIRTDIQGFKFSKPFVKTSTKLLLSRANKDKLGRLLNNQGEKLKIGIIQNSTTKTRVESYFNTSADVIVFPGRADALQALVSGNIDAFANDEIVLRGILRDQDFSRNKSYFISDVQIGSESYGLVLPDDDDEWVNIINRFLRDENAEIKKLIDQYFGEEPSINWMFLCLILLLVVPSLGFIHWVKLLNSAQEQKKTNTFVDGYALLIGVGESAYSRLSLPVTVKDVKALRQVLVDPNFCAYPNDSKHVRLLHDQEATRSKILEQLNWLKEQAEANPKATVVVYYSGHGWLNQNQNCYYLLPHDINPFNLESSALSAEEFTNALRQIKSERLLVIIDSCHAAGMATAKQISSGYFEETSVPKSVIDNLKQGKGRVIFTSSKGEESSWIRPDNQMSIYTYHLIEALKGKDNQAHDNVVKISHLMNYLSEQVPRSALSMGGKKQTPCFNFDTEDFPVALLKGRRPDRMTRDLK